MHNANKVHLCFALLVTRSLVTVLNSTDIFFLLLLSALRSRLMVSFTEPQNFYSQNQSKPTKPKQWVSLSLSLWYSQTAINPDPIAGCSKDSILGDLIADNGKVSHLGHRCVKNPVGEKLPAGLVECTDERGWWSNQISKSLQSLISSAGNHKLPSGPLPCQWTW